MGQPMGKIPVNQKALERERWRILRLSAEVLARVDDNVNSEDSFLMDYDNEAISIKIDKWLDAERSRIASVNEVAARPDREAELEKAFSQLFNEVHFKMRKDYEKAYEDMKRFTKVVDELAKDQRRIHKKIQELGEVYLSNERKFRKKFGRLRMKVFKNLRKSEKMLFRDERLKKQFVKKIYDVDQENIKMCKKKAKKLMEDFQIGLESN